MREKRELPSQKELDQAFHMLQNQITRITVEEEEEMVGEDLEKGGK